MTLNIINHNLDDLFDHNLEDPNSLPCGLCTGGGLVKS
jgi:hypothetical protein